MKFETLYSHLENKWNLDAWLGFKNDNFHNNGEFKVLHVLSPIVDAFIDVGAKYGEFSNEVYKTNNKCKIIAFEPDIRNNPKLQEIKNIDIHNVAIGNKKSISYHLKKVASHTKTINENFIKETTTHKT